MHLDPDVRVQRGTENSFIYYNLDFCWKYFVQKLRRHLLASNATNYSYSGATKYGYQRNPRNVGMTLLFVVLTKNDSFRGYSTFVLYLLRARILNNYTQLALMDINLVGVFVQTRII